MLNTVPLTGRLTKDVRICDNLEFDVTNFSVAVDFGEAHQLVEIGGRKVMAKIPVTTFFEASAWNGDRAVAATLVRGQEATFTLLKLEAMPRIAKDRPYAGQTFADLQARVTNIIPGALPKLRTENSTATTSESTHEDEEVPW